MSEQNQASEHTFTCPECGSHHFGSSGASETEPGEIHCHGYKQVEGLATAQPCRWSAPRTREGMGAANFERFEKAKDQGPQLGIAFKGAA